MTDNLSAAALSRLVDAQPWLFVTLNDARTAGACDHGIRQWCLNVRLNHKARRAPLRDVCLAYQQYPTGESPAAMLVTLRKRRRTVANARQRRQDALTRVTSSRRFGCKKIASPSLAFSAPVAGRGSGHRCTRSAMVSSHVNTAGVSIPRCAKPVTSSVLQPQGMILAMIPVRRGPVFNLPRDHAGARMHHGAVAASEDLHH